MLCIADMVGRPRPTTCAYPQPTCSLSSPHLALLQPVLVVGNISCVLSVLGFGLAGSYAQAMAARTVGGALNAIILAEKAILGEGGSGVAGWLTGRPAGWLVGWEGRQLVRQADLRMGRLVGKEKQ